MKTTELLFNHKNENVGITYNIFRVEDEHKVVIVVNKEEDNPYSVISTIEYENIGYEYESPYLSWENLIKCSNNSVTPFTPYMNYAVQKGRKLAATIYKESLIDKAFETIISNVPDNCNCYYNQEEHSAYGYICRKGTLSDFYSFDKIKETYEKHSVLHGFDWDRIRELFTTELIDFGNSEEKLSSIQGGVNNENMVILGLILGYPIESTISLLKGKTRTSSNSFNSMILDKMKQKGVEEYEEFGRKYFLYKGSVKSEWQKLDKYIKEV